MYGDGPKASDTEICGQRSGVSPRTKASSSKNASQKIVQEQSRHGLKKQCPKKQKKRVPVPSYQQVEKSVS